MSADPVATKSLPAAPVPVELPPPPKRRLKPVTRWLVAGSFAFGVFGVAQTVVLPNLREARKNGNETAAIGALKTIGTAQSLFRERDMEGDGQLDYGSLSELHAVGLIGDELGSGTYKGYAFTAEPGAEAPEFTWFGSARPVDHGVTGDRVFVTNHEGVTYYGARAEAMLLLEQGALDPQPVTPEPEPAPPAAPAVPLPADEPRRGPHRGQKERGGVRLAAAFQGSQIHQTQKVSDLWLHARVTIAEDAAGPERKPVDLVLVVDRSGSMAGEKLTLLKRAATELAGRLDEDDRVVLVSYSDDARVDYAGPARSDGVLEEAIQGLGANGSTNLSSGLEAGFATVVELPSSGSERLRHMLVLSDGAANKGVVDPAGLEDVVRQLRASRISVSSVGLGVNWNETLMLRLADAGGGQLHYASGGDALESIYAAELTALRGRVAHDARIELIPADGTTVARVFNWSTESKGDASVVPVGDLAAGRVLNVVAQLRNRLALGPNAVARVRLSYTDTDGAPQHLEIPLAVEACLDAEAALETRDGAVLHAVRNVRLAAELERIRGLIANNQSAEAEEALRDLERDGLGEVPYTTPDGRQARFSASELRRDLRRGRTNVARKRLMQAFQPVGR